MKKKKQEKTSLLELIRETYSDVEIWMADGVEDSVIGIDEDSMRLICSVPKAIQLIEKQLKVTKKDLDEDDIASGITVRDKRHEMAVEWFHFNTEGAKKTEGSVKDGTYKILSPIWCYTDFY